MSDKISSDIRKDFQLINSPKVSMHNEKSIIDSNPLAIGIPQRTSIMESCCAIEHRPLRSLHP